MVTFTDLRSVRFSRAEPWRQSEHIIPGVRRSEVAILAAAGASGKSYLTQQLALTRGAGAPAVGFDLAGTEEMPPRRVLLLQMEDLEEDLCNRGGAILRAYPDLDEGKIQKNVFAVSLPGQNLGLVADSQPQPEAEAQLAEFLRAHSIDLAVLDPLTNLWTGCDENDAGSATLLMDALRRVATAADAAILVCHHTNKNALFNGRANEQAAVRGSAVFINSARCAMTLSTPKEGQGDVVLTWVKVNNTPPRDPQPLWRGFRGVLYDDERLARRSIETAWEDEKTRADVEQGGYDMTAVVPF